MKTFVDDDDRSSLGWSASESAGVGRSGWKNVPEGSTGSGGRGAWFKLGCIEDVESGE
jgi:hypothetical protein